MKGKDFWIKLCNELGYKFFTGVPTTDLKVLYDAMTTDILHYIPTINAQIAVGIASGMIFTGKKAVVLMPSEAFKVFRPMKNMFINLPLLFIVENNYNVLDLKQFNLGKTLNVLDRVDKYLITESKASILVIKGNSLE